MTSKMLMWLLFGGKESVVMGSVMRLWVGVGMRGMCLLATSMLPSLVEVTLIHWLLQQLVKT